jgi:hypothetical protein
MSEEGKKKEKREVEEVREFIGVVSKELPSLIKGIIGSVFSEEAGRDMGKAAAAFYKQLKDAGMPEETAVKMTENYVSVFTSLGDMMKGAVGGKKGIKGEAIGEEVSKRVQERVKEKLAEKHVETEEEEEEDEDED